MEDRCLNESRSQAMFYNFHNGDLGERRRPLPLQTRAECSRMERIRTVADERLQALCDRGVERVARHRANNCNIGTVIRQVRKDVRKTVGVLD